MSNTTQPVRRAALALGTCLVVAVSGATAIPTAGAIQGTLRH